MFYATSIDGDWTGLNPIAPESNDTYGSQNSFELVIDGSKTPAYIYMGDAWLSRGSDASNYLWLPMSVETDPPSVTLEYHSMWKVDVNTGVVSWPTTKKRYEAEDAVLLGRAAVRDCDHCSSKRAVHQVHSESEVVFYNVTGSGSVEWFSFHYKAKNPSSGDAYVYVNDDPEAIYLSKVNHFAGHRPSVSVQLRLDPGDDNIIRFGGTGSLDFGLVLDAIELHGKD
ncbi:hypothetical protein QQX98_012734 [Neonectria punicea]|uniref:Uncharacterized protein n=1 Tax=Neonectria punicea TaxID=979145 RepID=A0ABR1GIA1_9HYPO